VLEYYINNSSFDLTLKNRNSHYKGQPSNYVYSAIIVVYSETHEKRTYTLNTNNVVITEP